MIEHFCVFTKSGIVLWDYSYSPLRGNPVNELIKTVLLEERQGQDCFHSGNYVLKWTQDNQSNLVFVVVWERQLTSKVGYLDELLASVKEEFKPSLQNKFGARFNELYTQAQQKKVRLPPPKNVDKPLVTPERDVSTPSQKDQHQELKESENIQSENIQSENIQSENTENSESTENTVKKEIGLEKEHMVAKTTQAKPSSTQRGQTSPKLDSKSNSTKQSKTGKKQRRWDEDGGDEDLGRFLSEQKPVQTSNEDLRALGVGEKINLESFDEKSNNEESNEPEDNKQSSGGLLQYLTNITNKELAQSDVEPVLAQFKTHLTSKNVAQEIAEKLCNSVALSLVGKKMSTFTRVSSAVKEAMEEALTRILTPKRTIDILRDARNAKQNGNPYSIVFVGVNGVGKSTTLSKVCSWLKQNDLSVLIAACDTFRAGAVEQLEVHAKNLDVPLHHKGYGKNAATVAKEAIVKARRDKLDVVLIDTAGRMQDNEPLMDSLAKLVGQNKPDLVLFVGEALVGNDSVDQLTKFNRALEEYSTSKEPRFIDGIILSKFDTVDDKVGAAISMVYATGQPIVFVGVGQKYSDLRVLNVPRIVSILLKGN